MDYIICDEKTRTISNIFKVKDINKFFEFMEYVQAEKELEVLVFVRENNIITVQLNCDGEILGMENGKHSFDYDYFVTNMRKHLPAGEVMFLSTVTEESYVCDEEEKAFVQYKIRTHMIMKDGDIRFKFEDLINAYGNIEGFWEGKKNIFPM